MYGGSYGANGVYLQNAENNFVKEDGSWTLDWKGCQWVLKRVSVVVNVICADDIPAANELFGNSFIGGAKYPGVVQGSPLGLEIDVSTSGSFQTL